MVSNKNIETIMKDLKYPRQHEHAKQHKNKISFPL